MEAQEARAELPRPELSELLAKHYGRLYPDDEIPDDGISLGDTCDECKELVIGYLREKPSIAHEDIIFIKRFTKVANHIFNRGPEHLDGLMERLYDYHLQGIMKVQDEIIKGNDDPNLNTIRAHLHSYAAGVSHFIFGGMKDDNSMPFAKKVFWGNETYNNEMTALTLIQGNPQFLSIRHDNAGDICIDMACLMKDGQMPEKIEWLERAYAHKSKAAEMFLCYDPSLSATVYKRAAETARSVFDMFRQNAEIPLERKMEWGVSCYRSHMESAEAKKKLDPKFSAFEYKEAAEMCRSLHELTGQARYIEECYSLHSLAARMTVKKIPSFSALQEGVLGDLAMEIYNLAGESRWVKAAKRHYEKFLSYHLSIKESNQSLKLLSRRKSMLDRIRRKIKSTASHL